MIMNYTIVNKLPDQPEWTEHKSFISVACIYGAHEAKDHPGCTLNTSIGHLQIKESLDYVRKHVSVYLDAFNAHKDEQLRAIKDVAKVSAEQLKILKDHDHGDE